MMLVLVLMLPCGPEAAQERRRGRRRRRVGAWVAAKDGAVRVLLHLLLLRLLLLHGPMEEGVRLGLLLLRHVHGWYDRGT